MAIVLHYACLLIEERKVGIVRSFSAYYRCPYSIWYIIFYREALLCLHLTDIKCVLETILCVNIINNARKHYTFKCNLGQSSCSSQWQFPSPESAHAARFQAALGGYEILMKKLGCCSSCTSLLIVLTVPLNCLRQIASRRSLCYLSSPLLTTSEVF